MTFNQIATEIKKDFDVDVFQKSRQLHVVMARYLCIHCLFYYSTEIRSIKKIADYLGISQQGTILHALNEFSDAYETDRHYKKLSNKFIDKVVNDYNSFYEIDTDINARTKILESKIKYFKEELKKIENGR